MRAMAAAFCEQRRVERLRVRVDAVDDGAVDADRRVRAGVVHDSARSTRSGQPQRAPGVAALDAAVEVVPVIQQPALEPRALGDVERASGCRSGSGAGSGTRRRARRPRPSTRSTVAACPPTRRRANDVALVAEARERVGPAERGDQRRRDGVPTMTAPCGRRAIHAGHVDAESSPRVRVRSSAAITSPVGDLRRHHDRRDGLPVGGALRPCRAARA